MTTATTGTGTMTLGSAVTGFQSFADAGISDADVVAYTIRDGSNWEVGTGTYTSSGTTLSRSVTESNNADSAINLSGSAVVYITARKQDLVGKQTVWIPASAMIAATTSGPASAQIEETTNNQNYKVLDFDATSDEYAHFNIALPKGYNKSTITFQAFWATAATDTDGVAWGLQALARADNEAIDATWGTAVVVTDDAQGAANELLVTSESGAITVSAVDDDLTFFRLFRDVSDANDVMTEDARLIGIKLFYTTDSITDD